MKTGIISMLLAILLVLTPCLPALAEDNGTGEVTITVNTESVIAITLSQTNWPIGDVASNEEHKTQPAATWCTITSAGNANVNIKIKGDDAKWVAYPEYKWALITNESHVTDEERPDEYALWYHIANDTAESYTLITKEEVLMIHVKDGSSLDGSPLNLRAHSDYAQFGLKLLTPTYFYANRKMETQITISAVKAA